MSWRAESIPSVSRDRNKATDKGYRRVCIAYECIAYECTHGWFIPHLFRIDVERPHHETSGGFNSRASVGVTGGRPSVPHHWGQRSTWVFRFLPNRTFCFRHLLESLFENFRHEKCFKHRRSDDCNWANVIYTVLFFFLFFFFRPPCLNRLSSFLIYYRGPFRLEGGCLGEDFSLDRV